MFIFIALLFSMLVVNLIVLGLMRQKYPKELEDWDNPSGLVSNTTNASFLYGYIGTRQYRRIKLDSNTRMWCETLFIIVWAFLIYSVSLGYQVLSVRW